ncbi:MAG TPA: insulinase family protein [Sphingomonas sp.]|jgi:zinc protease
MATVLMCAAVPLGAQTPGPVAVNPAGDTAWLYRGSDIPQDPAWRFGTLSNGLRYALRRNALPAGTLSIRVRIGAGGLEERPDEQGYAHFLEHMLFRGTAAVPDGEAIRVWQRLGASFGADTNAFTSLTATTYVLDLPRTDTASVDTALSVLSGMMRQATLGGPAVDIERKVVIAERDLRLPPLARRLQDLTKPLLFSGTRAATSEVTGTEQTLSAATPDRLRAFYDRWYRPDNAVLTIVGDIDVAQMEVLARRHFGGWTGRGPAPRPIAYGTPVVPAITSAVLSDPQASNGLALFWVRAHDDRPWTKDRQAVAYVRELALRIINRRLTRKARAGAGFVAAGASQSEGRHGVDLVQIGATTRTGQAQQALNDLYGVLADIDATPPTAAEIAREAADIDELFRARVAGETTATSPALANLLIQSVDEGDVVATATTYATIFAASKAMLAPDKVGAVMRSLISGPPRALLTSPAPVPGGQPGFARTLVAARAIKAAARSTDRDVSFADLAPPAAPGRIVSRTQIADYDATRIRFANGVDLVVKRTPFDKDRVAVVTLVGNGMAALDPARPAPLWSLGAVAEGGIGPFDADALERLMAGRRLGIALSLGEREIRYSGFTNQRDLADELRLLGAAVAEPRFDPSSLGRLKDAAVQNYDTSLATPGGAAGTMITEILHGGDKRYAYPARDAIAALTLDAFRGFWTPLLAPGIRRVVILGDVDVEAAIRAAAATVGATPARPQQAVAPDRLDSHPFTPAATPVIIRHRGDPAQAIAVVAWPTTGGLADLDQTRALRVAADIVQARLFDRFREAEGGGYAPNVASAASLTQPSFGLFSASSQLRRDRIPDFERAVREIQADLATNGPTADEVARVVTPIVSGNERALRTNGYWQGVLIGDLDDPRLHRVHATIVAGYRGVTPAAVKAAMMTWIAGKPSLRIQVLGPGKP